MRLITGLPFGTPTKILLQRTNSLSIQQLIAKTTLLMVFKIIHSSKPKYLADRMKVRSNLDGRRLPDRCIAMLDVPKYNLSLSKEGFVVRGCLLLNKLPVSLRLENDLKRFKHGMVKWVSEHISAKPE